MTLVHNQKLGSFARESSFLPYHLFARVLSIDSGAVAQPDIDTLDEEALPLCLAVCGTPDPAAPLSVMPLPLQACVPTITELDDVPAPWASRGDLNFDCSFGVWCWY